MAYKTLTPKQMRARRAKRQRIVDQVTCPDCGAQPGDNCWRSDRGGKTRLSPHIERIRVYYHPLVVEE